MSKGIGGSDDGDLGLQYWGGDQKQELLALTVIRPGHCNRRPFKDCQSFAMIKLSQGCSCDAIPLGCRRSVYIYDIQKNRISG